LNPQGVLRLPDLYRNRLISSVIRAPPAFYNYVCLVTHPSAAVTYLRAAAGP
jgi:hypothetical protein